MVPEGFCACPVDVAFEVVGKKWTVLLIRNLLRGPRHFNEFIANIDGLSPRILSSRLKELEREKLILKKIQRTTPLSIEYSLTEKGLAVMPILEQMVRWSIAWAPERIFDLGRDRQDIEACVEEWESVVRGRPRDGVYPSMPISGPRRKLTDSA